jgi:hypothetical protein
MYAFKLMSSLRCFTLFALLVCTAGANQAEMLQHRTRVQQKEPKSEQKQHHQSLKYLLDHHKLSDDDCSQTSRYSIDWRLKHYPFKKAAKILLVSYHPLGVQESVIRIDDERTIDSIDTLPAGLRINNGKLEESTIVEKSVLRQTQIQSLTNIIYNVTYRDAPIHAIIRSACEPDFRNAILFVDKHHRIYDYMEVCFECNQFYTKSDKFSLGTICTQKYDILRRFFLKAGIKFGTKEYKD